MLGAYAIAYVFLSLVVLGVLAVAPAGELASPYVQWGWRIPFLLGALVGFLLLLCRARVPESDTWQRARKVDRPLKTLVGPALRRDLAQVLLVMTGLWLMSGSVASFMPRVLLTRYDASATAVTSALLAAHVALLVTVVLVGMGSQVVGRRAMLVLGAGAAVLLGLPLYAVVVSGAVSPAVAFLLAGAVHVFVVGAWGAASSYCNERFPTAVRSSGFGIGYSVSLVLPSLSPLYVAGLGRLMPFEYTPLVLLVIGAALLAVGALRGPETADVDLTGFDVDADGALPTLPTQRGTTTAEVARL
jgi:predicted MFS family arabinose efflux permease